MLFRSVDGGIIGGPPKPNYNGPVFYFSGADAHAAAVLNEFGLPCKVIDGPIGAASALASDLLRLLPEVRRGIDPRGPALQMLATGADERDARLMQGAEWYNRQNG